MGFFSRLMRKSRLKRKKSALLEKPSPRTTKELVEAYLEAGQEDNAFNVAQQGVDLYPRSAAMRDLFQKLSKVRFTEEIKKLQSEIKSKPNPISYARLADLLYSIGRNDEALAVCREGSEKYPEYEGNYLIAAKIRYQRFKEDYIAKDGEIAVQYFEKALGMNPANYKTLLQLAEIYTEIGAFNKAMEKIELLLAARPDDERSYQLKKYIQSVGVPAEENITELFRKVEEIKGKTGCNSLEDPDMWAISYICKDFSEIKGRLQFFFGA